jgi:hypothetical protein
MKKHSFLTRVLARAAKEAGLRADVEPAGSKAQCRRIFPKKVSQRYKDQFMAVINAMEMVASPACDWDEARKLAYVQAKIDALPSVKNDDTTGLRIDLALENEETGEAKWIDVTVVHTGAESYLKKELKAVSDKLLTAKLTSTLSLPDPLKSDPSPTLLERTTAKIEKYSRLLLVAKKQAGEKKRKQAPVFSTFAVSDYGEAAPVAQDLQEWLVNQYRIKCEQAGKRSDGVKPLDLVRDFRNRLRLGIQMALAAGCGEMLCHAGRAWG